MVFVLNGSIGVYSSNSRVMRSPHFEAFVRGRAAHGFHVGKAPGTGEVEAAVPQSTSPEAGGGRGESIPSTPSHSTQLQRGFSSVPGVGGGEGNRNTLEFGILITLCKTHLSDKVNSVSLSQRGKFFFLEKSPGMYFTPALCTLSVPYSSAGCLWCGGLVVLCFSIPGHTYGVAGKLTEGLTRPHQDLLEH